MLFISPQKLFLFSRCLNLYLEFLFMQEKGLIREIGQKSKFMMLQPGKQSIATQILPYISRNKDNQTVKFGQLIEYNMRQIFL